jgi:hypothetical protein
MKAGPAVQLSAVIIRACSSCGQKRELGKPCAGCGSMTPPDVTDLGVIAGSYRGFWRRLKWNLWQYHAAQRRIRKINKEMLRACGQ